MKPEAVQKELDAIPAEMHSAKVRIEGEHGVTLIEPDFEEREWAISVEVPGGSALLPIEPLYFDVVTYGHLVTDEQLDAILHPEPEVRRQAVKGDLVGAMGFARIPTLTERFHIHLTIPIGNQLDPAFQAVSYRLDTYHRTIVLEAMQEGHRSYTAVEGRAVMMPFTSLPAAIANRTYEDHTARMPTFAFDAHQASVSAVPSRPLLRQLYTQGVTGYMRELVDAGYPGVDEKMLTAESLTVAIASLVLIEHAEGDLDAAHTDMPLADAVRILEEAGVSLA